MGLFDRFSKSKGITIPESGLAAAQNSGLSAEHWLDKGMQLERQGQMDDALRSYDLAIHLMPELARAHFNRGNILLDRGDAQEALAAYTKAAKHKPDSASNFYNMGLAQRHLGQQDAAAASFLSAIALKPDYVDAEVAVAGALEELGKLDSALLHYRRAFEIDPNCADAFFQQGLAFQDRDSRDQAEERYRLVLKISPDHFDAINNLGVLLIHKEQFEDAARCFYRLLELKPDSADIHKNLGIALAALGQSERAIASFQRALAINPNDAMAHILLGNVLRDGNQLEAAVAAYGCSLALDPDNIEVLVNQGIALQNLGQLDAAIDRYSRALELKPDFAEVLSNLGAIHKQRSQFSAAVDCFQRALDIKPDFVEAHCNLGNALQALGKLDAAEQSYLRALEIDPGFGPAYGNYGTLFQSRGQFDIAEAHYRRAIEIQPDLHDPHNNLGIILNLTRRFTESIASLRRALELKPDYAPAYINLANVLKDLGQIDEALEHLRHVLKLDPDNSQAQSNLLFIHNYLQDEPASLMFAEARLFGEMVDRKARPYEAWNSGADPERLLRIGFVSGDLCSHPVGYFIEGVLAALTSQALGQFELVAYPTRICDDETSQRIKSCCSGWHSTVGLTDQALAHRIHDDGIDILIDLSGHSAHSRLPVFAWKPAPVQVSWLGYFATTGLSAVDYFIADPWTLPEAEEAFFTEQVWRLPDTRLCFTAPSNAIDVSPLPALTNGYVTFGCFNNLTKMNDEVVAVWARILRSSSDSRLFLKSQQLAEPSLQQEICMRFAAHGIDAHRLILEDYGPRADYLAAYHRVDLCLDPFPYPGGTTTAESLWMGVPVLTLAGERFLSRQGVGLLMCAGLPDWVATDPDDYVARAVSHASDPQRLATLRAGLRQQVLASPLFDAPRFARHFEAALRGMWQTWCAKNAGAPLPTEEAGDGTV